MILGTLFALEMKINNFIQYISLSVFVNHSPQAASGVFSKILHKNLEKKIINQKVCHDNVSDKKRLKSNVWMKKKY